MTVAHITAILLDGSKHEATGVFRALADKVAWEREFKTSFVSFQKVIGDSVTPDGAIDRAANLESLTSEREAFLPWRLLNREKVFAGTFDEFLDNCESLEVQILEDERGEPLDPTATDPSPTSSQA